MHDQSQYYQQQVQQQQQAATLAPMSAPTPGPAAPGADPQMQQLLALLHHQQQHQQQQQPPQQPQYHHIQQQQYTQPPPPVQHPSALDQLLSQLTQENLRLKLQIQQLQSQPPRERVLVLLPSTVAVDNLSLTDIAAEAAKIMGRPASLVDVSVTVAQSPIVTSRQEAIARHVEEARQSMTVSTRSASVASARSTRPAGGSRSASVMSTRSTAGQVSHSGGPAVRAQEIKADEEMVCAPLAADRMAAAAASESDEEVEDEPVANDKHAATQAAESEAGHGEDDQASAASDDSDLDAAAHAANNHHRKPSPYDAIDQLTGTLWGTNPPPAPAASLPTAVPAIVPYTAPKPKPATPDHPFHHSIVTTDRPEGTGLAPYHVTIRGLRPSTTKDQLLVLAREYKSLKQLFYPPHSAYKHVGRAAIYFFDNRPEAFAFGEGLRRRLGNGDLQKEFALTADDKREAWRRGVMGEGPGGEFSERQTELQVRNADMTRTPAYASGGGGGGGVSTWQASKRIEWGPPAGADVDDSDSDDDDQLDAPSRVPDLSRWDQEAIVHWTRMQSLLDKDGDIPASLLVPPHLSSSLVSTTGVGLIGIDHRVHVVAVQNIRPAATATDLLVLARYCESLVGVHYPPLVGTRDIVGRTALYYFKDRYEARAFGAFVVQQVRQGKCAHLKVKRQDKMDARRQGVVSKGDGPKYAAWQVRIKVNVPIDGMAEEKEDEDETEWHGVGGKKYKVGNRFARGV